MSTPTQVAQPARATWRTVVQTGISLVLVASIVLPIVWQIVQEELDRQGFALPSSVVVVVVGALAAVAALAGILARVMAIPQVNAALSRVGLSAEPAGQRYLDVSPTDGKPDTYER